MMSKLRIAFAVMLVGVLAACHSGTKLVDSLAVKIAWLICAFHRYFLVRQGT